jgi:glycosyltransferase involved in cell wall biosynthesis
LIVPGKTYEYLASKKPILACVPDSDVRDIVLNSGVGYVCDPSDTESIGKTMLWLFDQYKSNNGIPRLPNDGFIKKYERRQLTKNLVQIFENIMDRR